MTGGSITVLVENTVAQRHLLAEHGLSFWLEWHGQRILFDTGQGYALGHNTRQLGLRLKSTNAVILSHGHYDHVGGLGDALRLAGRIDVYLHHDALNRKYARNPDGSARDAGMPAWTQQAIRSMAKPCWVEQPIEIGDGLHLTGPIPRHHDFEDPGGPFFKDQGCTEPDDLPDDQAAFLDTPDGTVVILGCAHAGIINTLHHVRALTNDRPIHTVIGGMHLLNANARRLERTVAALRQLAVQRLFPCHCTGLAATIRLWHEFPGQCCPCPVGTVIPLPE